MTGSLTWKTGAAIRLDDMLPLGREQLGPGRYRYGYNGRMDKGPTIAVVSPTGTGDAQQSLLRSLLARVANGEVDALASFYDATVARVYAVAYRITRDAPAAEEVVSDVYLQLWRNTARYDAARGPVIAWLLVMCRSRALDSLRRRDPAELHPAPEELRPDLDRVDNDPFDDFAALERASHVHTAIATLDARSQRLLALAFFQGLSHHEIADRTGLPLGTVKTVLRTAMRKIRARLTSTAVYPESQT